MKPGTFKIVCAFCVLLLISINAFTQEKSDAIATSMAFSTSSIIKGVNPVDNKIKGASFYLASGKAVKVDEFNDSVNTSKYYYELSFKENQSFFNLKKKEKSIFNYLGKRFPASEFIDFKGKKVIFNAKLTYINFWGLSCKPCMEELQLIDSISKRYPKVNFLAIANDDDQKIKEFLSTHNFDLRFIKNGKALTSLFEVDYNPMHILIDKNNYIIKIIPGTLSKSNLELLVSALAE